MLGLESKMQYLNITTCLLSIHVVQMNTGISEEYINTLVNEVHMLLLIRIRRVSFPNYALDALFVK